METENTTTQTLTESKRPDSSPISDELRMLGLRELVQQNRKAYSLPPMEDERLKIYISDLWAHPLDQVALAMARCRRELQFGVSGSESSWPKISDITQRLESVEQHSERMQDALARLAFVKAQDITEKYLRLDSVSGRYRLTAGEGKRKLYVNAEDPNDTIYRTQPNPVPPIPERLEWTVRQCGGWERFRNLHLDEYLHVLQKDFIAHYKAYDAVKQVEYKNPQLATGDLGQKIKELAGSKAM